ncbi:uncharacterized protein EAE97_011292 [Botrytis byssoidea]|uniref:Uncharacterized protein n=1 Tax=Botrytis byssoidea TaxID=139641 RepID=A0A9P5LRB5_9HELO|nr:uncharacterized protein EAE97_011292 [Botrytis byssoidea]KAF7921503.1 hypothetical protein EAE97_011292 [Botrytis byssoidea]
MASAIGEQEGVEWTESLLTSVAEISGARPRITIDDDERSTPTVNLVTKCFGAGYENLVLSMEES